MNYRFVINQLSMLLIVMSVVMLGLELAFLSIAALQEIQTAAPARLAVILTGTIGVMLAGVVWFGTRSDNQQLYRREAMLLVAASWLFGAGYAAIPYFIWAHLSDQLPEEHVFRNFVDCYFEAMSGLTTTGATVLGEIEALPKSLLLWRAFTQWLGGLGIVVLFVAVLPSLGVGGKKLYRVEAPGPRQESVTPNIRETARVLWFIYVGLTIIEIALLMVFGMSGFDAVCHTFTTLATGGFSTSTASIGGFNQASMIIIMVFMFFAGTNFSLFYEAIRGRIRNVLRDVELRVYVGTLLAGGGVIVVSLMMSAEPVISTTGRALNTDLETAALEGAFAAVSIQTTTGYCTSDFDMWPFAAKSVLLMMMFVGGSGGSTAGGIKVIRVWVMLKVLIVETERVFRPNVVRTVRLGGTVIDQELRQSTVAYVLAIVLIFALGSIGVMLLEQFYNPELAMTYETAATASIATLSNVGPGFGAVGAVEHYGWMSTPTKALLSLLMVIGRLEMFAILVLFSPQFWRST